MMPLLSVLLSVVLTSTAPHGSRSAPNLVEGSRVHVIGDRLAADLAVQDEFVAAVEAFGSTVYSHAKEGNEAAFIELPGEVRTEDLVVLCVGAVDAIRGDAYLKGFRDRLGSILDDLPSGRVVLVTPVPSGPEAHEDQTACLNHAVVVGRYADVIGELARRRECHLIDLHGSLSMVQQHAGTSSQLHDGLHLNASGLQFAAADLLWQLGWSEEDPDFRLHRSDAPASSSTASVEADMLRGDVPLRTLPALQQGLPPAPVVRLAPHWDEAVAAVHELAGEQVVDAAALRNAMFLLTATPDRAQSALEVLRLYSTQEQPEPVRLAALAAIDDLPADTVGGPAGIKTIRIDVVPVKMTYEPSRFEVMAGEPVRLILSNPDAQPHNLLICKPGSLRAIGSASEAMGTTAEAKARDWVPDSPKVLHVMPMVQLGEEGELRFMAPQRPGRYPIICTYPGHWRMMNGVMTVRRNTD
ncbi:MAG: GDSL-type esterase/lipase family protein [Phycisphaerales bacterium]|nr:GDSL-type esterase/lipase family protein [Phycisphaerales bacterium]